ncbi:Exocyst complex component 5 [Neophaeococcomyces mojaviensis]|uniref:Exocyst complex component 5 n=1 Tax=Neophaeococcomyces mojaviensis TaxID=3383035 RepID=A0ACC3AEU9_9EURO|nr:Exocyst complex component 5 [Knufia sp. JES_112]
MSSVSTSSNATEQASRALYGKGPVFSLDNFSSRDFIVKDFIESLTDAAQPTRRSQGPQPNAFDSKPLIRAFEQASRRLNELSEELTQKETELAGGVRRAEAQHASNTDTLGRKLNQTINSFQKLDTSLKSDRGEKWGGNVAVETGKRLEELDRQRRRAMDAHFLIECWDEVSNRGEVTLLENLRRSGTGEGKIRSARIAKQLLRISQRLDPASHGSHSINGAGKQVNGITNGVNGARHFNTREIIEKFIETLENDMLKLFDDFYRRQNFEEMKNCATVLQDFNGGASVQAAFVNQHQFFIDRSNLVTDEVGGDQETWVRLSDPDADLPGVEPGLQSLIDEVKVVVQEESQIIKRAFPNPEQVLGKFVQRVFQQSIQQRLELVLDKAESESTLAYLRSLQAARNSINALVEDLKSHGLTEHPDPVTSQTSQLLDQQLDELFTPYFGGSAYIDKEKQNLSELYRSLLFKFELFHSRRQKEPKTYLASLRSRGQELLVSAREATDAYVKSLDLEKMSSTQKRILLSVAGLKNTTADDTSTSTKPNEIDLNESDGRLNTEFAKRMLKWLAEGVRRGLELSGGSETPKDVSALHTLLLRNMGENYIELSLDAAADSASTAESAKRDAPDLNYLSHLKAAISIMHLMQSCTNTLLIPLASSSLTIRRDMEKNARTSLLRMEDHINIIEQRTIDAILNWTSRLLSQQSRTDFRPKDMESDAALALSSTATCAAVLKFLSSFQDSAKSTFASGPNLTNILTEIGVEFRSQLLEHFKKWQVNRLGAIMLVRDISAYVELLRSWDLGAQFNGTLEMLVEIGSLFVLKPEAVKERIRGGQTGGTNNATGQTGDGGNASAGNEGSSALANVNKENLRPYLMKREDYMEVGMQNLLYGL